MAGGASDSDEAIVGINVTPLVDITLVLLIIFMVTARIIVSQSVPMDLPKAASGTDVQVVFSAAIGADGKLLVDSKGVPDDEAIFALAREAHTKNPDVRAVIKADIAQKGVITPQTVMMAGRTSRTWVRGQAGQQRIVAGGL